MLPNSPIGATDVFARLPDQGEPKPPYFLKADDIFARQDGRELYIKKIYSTSHAIRRRGNVVLAPGLATNANIFRIDDLGGFLRMDHKRSMANLLAAEGFTVYLYHPGYTERVHNRYVYQHCKQSLYYHRRYKAPADLTFTQLVEEEVPLLLDTIEKDSGEPVLSWVGYSLGGMLVYAHLAANPDCSIKNVVTIGSPVTLHQLFIRVIPYTNMSARALGMEETAVLGTISQNFVPLTRLIRKMPSGILRYNPFTFFLWNPMNISGKVVKLLLGKIVEPIPHSLESSFAAMIAQGIDCEIYGPALIRSIAPEKRATTNFLFFFGQNDLIAPPDSVLLSQGILCSRDMDNIIGVPGAGHVDLIIGRNSYERVWKPTARFLMEKTQARPRLHRLTA
ncbi:MAG: hypothetical protein AB1921_01110 [Thermodesulfobacteriota bacterium]